MNKNIKVVHFLPSITPRSGGLFNSVHGLALADKNLGYNVFVISGWEIGIRKFIERWNIFRLIIFPKFPPYRFSYMPGVFLYLCFLRPEVIHIHGVWSYHAFIALIYKYVFPNTRLIVSPRGMVSDYSLNRSILFKKIALFLYVKNLFNKCDVVHVLSNIEEQEVLETFKINGVVILHPNVLSNDFLNISFKSTIIDKRKRVNFFYLSRIHPKKNIESLIIAFKDLIDNDFNAFLSIYGEGDADYVLNLKKLIIDLNINDFVEFKGHVLGESKIEVYMKMDIFILNSLSEGLPMAAIEALYANKVVIVSKYCNLSDASGIPGFHVTDGTLRGLKVILRDLFLTDFDKYEVFSRNDSLNELGYLKYSDVFLKNKNGNCGNN